MHVRTRNISSREDHSTEPIRKRGRDSSPQPGYSLRTVVIISFAVTIVCQTLVPYLVSHIQSVYQVTKYLPHKRDPSNLAYLNHLITTEGKDQTNGLNAPAVRKQTFLVDPLFKDKWKDVMTSEPVMIDDGKTKTDLAKVKEALAAAKAAKKSRNDGNIERALVIIKHAIALAPDNPDILIEMGQVQEQQDLMIEADQCYVQALAYDPDNIEALEHRAKTAPIVSAIDRKMLKKVHDLRNEFSQLQHSTALRRMMRETYFLYVYHTVAIEGNTLSLGETRAVLESGVVIPGKSIREHNEIIGMDSALRYLNSSLLSRDHDIISIEDILQIHRRVLGNSDPIEAGKLRTTQVYVGKFTPVSPEFVAEQMEELVSWLNDEKTLTMDPIEKAAIAHYKLVLVHPFTDGNGRTARLLLNLIMMRSGFPPVILPVESRAEYYATLHVANLGDLRPFVRYVAKHSEISIKSYIGAMKTSEKCIEKEEVEIDGLQENGKCDYDK